MEARLESPHRSQLQRHKVKEERAIRFRGQADEFAFRLRRGRVIDVLEIRRLAAEARAVVDDLAIDLSRCVINESHRIRSAAPSCQGVGVLLGLGEQAINLIVGNLCERSCIVQRVLRFALDFRKGSSQFMGHLL